MGKLKILFWMGVGYVLGARAGRERYEQIRAGAQRFASNPTVQRTVTRAEEKVRDRAPFIKSMNHHDAATGFPVDPARPGA